MCNICNFTHDGGECEQVRQQHVIHRQPGQRMQEVEECSFELIKCHGCTELMSAIGRVTKTSKQPHRCGIWLVMLRSQ